MPPFVLEVVMWTCVVAFVLCVIGGLLIVFGRWEPKDPKVKKWLLNGVLFSVVGGVVGFAGKQFTTPGSTPAPIERLASNQTVAEPAIGTRTPDPPPGADAARPPVVPPPANADNAIPEAVRSWAGRALGERPLLSQQAAAAYPTCVARLGALDIAAVTQADARACRREVTTFHASVILPYYNRKTPYDRALTVQEAQLRERSDDPRYLYVRAEMDRLNGDDSAEEDLILSLDERYMRDIRACARARCQG
jgi:hypothetical protein